MERGSDELPEVTEDDIREVEQRLEVTFDSSRRDILQSNRSFDVLACPGSGKTTLLVAKLAIMAKKWPYDRRGICVLSHTNVARQEIEQKLAGSAGERLLSYPHYVGTIHGFVDTFLALPLLRSEGRQVKVIDDDICGRFCSSKLFRDDDFLVARSFLNTKRKLLNKTINNLRYVGKDLDLGVAGGKLPCKPNTASFACLLNIKNAAAMAGLWRFDDMFAFAERLLEAYPETIKIARWRFPAFFADEAQDTSEVQSRVLARIFSLDGCTLRQRFGDSNQAIYDHGQAQARTDVFPGLDVREIASSQRFDHSIAMKAGPLAPRQQELVGEGPPRARLIHQVSCKKMMPHTVFLFGPDSVRNVFPAFAQLLLENFPVETLRSDRFLARAIGRVGKPSDEVDGQAKKFPRGLSDYWPEYKAEAAKSEPRPQSLADFIHLAQRQRVAMGDCAPAVATATKGIIELLSRASILPSVKAVWGLKDLREILRAYPQALRALEHLLWQWCVEATSLCEGEWIGQLGQLRTALAPLLQDRKIPEATEFCRWSAIFAGRLSNEVSGRRGLSNLYHFPEKEPKVEIDVGTIHSAKGQTHAATLVVETFFYEHDIEDLLEWLIGSKHGAEKRCKRMRLERMRLIYTAMTRPSHLLCLAMREQAVTKVCAKNAAIDAFQSRGWEVKFL